MKQSDLKELAEYKFKPKGLDLVIEVVCVDGNYMFRYHDYENVYAMTMSLNEIRKAVLYWKPRISSKDFTLLTVNGSDTGVTMYDFLKMATWGRPKHHNNVRSDCETAVAVMNEKEPKNDKIFLHSCHHLSSELKDVAVYMIKFMRICKKCSFNTYYTVMRDKFDRLSYEDRNEVTYRLLQDKVIMTLDSMYGDKCYQYTP